MQMEDNIRMDLEEIGISAGNWADSAQDKECGIEPPSSISHRVSQLVNNNNNNNNNSSERHQFVDGYSLPCAMFRCHNT